MSCDKKSEDPTNNKVLFSESLNNDTPENTVKSWLYYMDNNQFKEAKGIATESAILFLNEIESFIKNNPDEDELSKSQFIELTCKKSLKTAICFAKIKDEVFKETYTDTFNLIHKDAKWLIDTYD